MKKRLDILLFEKGLTDSREKAQRLIMAGLVFVNEKKETKAGMKFDEESIITLAEASPYVGRGAEKLKGAHEAFKINFENKIITDIGSSTGGFTDYALQNGAKKVYAIDVGTGQLDWRLRNDQRVVVMEKTDFRKLDILPEKIDMFVADVSFISIRKILQNIKNIAKDYGQKENIEIVILFKPQFEVGKEIASKTKGVIKDGRLHQKLMDEFSLWCRENGFQIINSVISPIKGEKAGNTEFLFYLKLC